MNLPQQLDGVGAVGGLADHFDVGLALEAQTNRIPRERLVVDDHGFDGQRHATSLNPSPYSQPLTPCL